MTKKKPLSTLSLWLPFCGTAYAVCILRSTCIENVSEYIAFRKNKVHKNWMRLHSTGITVMTTEKKTQNHSLSLTPFSQGMMNEIKSFSDTVLNVVHGVKSWIRQPSTKHVFSFVCGMKAVQMRIIIRFHEIKPKLLTFPLVWQTVRMPMNLDKISIRRFGANHR